MAVHCKHNDTLTASVDITHKLCDAVYSQGLEAWDDCKSCSWNHSELNTVSRDRFAICIFLCSSTFLYLEMEKIKLNLKAEDVKKYFDKLFNLPSIKHLSTIMYNVTTFDHSILLHMYTY